MRWDKCLKKSGPKEGDIRTRAGFLFFPKQIAGQTRWLERATWHERYGWQWTSSFSGTYIFGWSPITWANT